MHRPDLRMAANSAWERRSALARTRLGRAARWVWKSSRATSGLGAARGKSARNGTFGIAHRHFVNTPAPERSAADWAAAIRDQLPAGGLFADQHWQIAPRPFPLPGVLAKEFEALGRVLLQFYRAVNLLYRQSLAGKQPEWVARWLDLGKSPELLEWQRSAAFKNELPRVIRPDCL